MFLPNVPGKHEKAPIAGAVLIKYNEKPGVVFNVAHDVAHSAEVLHLLIRHFNAEFVLEAHHEINEIQAVCIKILCNIGFHCDTVLIDVQLIAHDCTNALKNHD